MLLGHVNFTLRDRQTKTDGIVNAASSLAEPCRGWDGEGKDLRWVLLHLINETARHAGHADAVESCSTALLVSDAQVVPIPVGLGEARTGR